MSGAGTPPSVPSLWALDEIAKMKAEQIIDTRWGELGPEIQAIAGLAGVVVIWSLDKSCWLVRLRRGSWYADAYVEVDAPVAIWRLTCGSLLDKHNGK